MTEHTPGPWVFEASTPSDGFECYWVTPELLGTPLCDVRGPQNPENEANARLIAAAPDLLAALKDFVETTELTSFARINPHGVYATAKAVIAKVEGK